MKCLQSLIPGSGAEWQLVLLENGRKLKPELVEFARSLTPDFLLLTAEKIMTPGEARNFAISESKGDWLFFIDDDAYLLQGYWDKILPLLEDNKADVIGGPDAPAEKMSALPTALALTLASPFCTGATFARHRPQGQKLQVTNDDRLTSCNLWIRKASLLGELFPEDYKRAEELLFLQKLSARGRVLVYHPLLRVGHHRRKTLGELVRPAFYAGFYRSRLMKEKLRKGNEAFWLPALFVLLHFLIFLDPVSFWYLARMYVSIILFVSIALCMQAKQGGLVFHVALLHYFIVYLYGIGFLTERLGLVRK